jgi:hypothetical protein
MGEAKIRTGFLWRILLKNVPLEYLAEDSRIPLRCLVGGLVVWLWYGLNWLRI